MNDIDDFLFQEMPFKVNDTIKKLLHNLEGSAQVFKTSEEYVLEFKFRFPKTKPAKRILMEGLSIIERDWQKLKGVNSK